MVQLNKNIVSSQYTCEVRNLYYSRGLYATHHQNGFVKTSVKKERLSKNIQMEVI